MGHRALPRQRRKNSSRCAQYPHLGVIRTGMHFLPSCHAVFRCQQRLRYPSPYQHALATSVGNAQERDAQAARSLPTASRPAHRSPPMSNRSSERPIVHSRTIGMGSTTLPPSADVVIAGAGPSGLALAAELMRSDVTPLVIDRQGAGANTSRACVVHARTMEVLAPLGATSDLLEQGIRVPVFRIRDRDRTLITVDFSEIASPYPFTLMCPQDRIEHCLLSHLERLGGSVVRPCELIGCREVGSHVETDVRTAGAIRTINARWLV